MPTVIVVGATRGLGAALAKRYATQQWTVLATARGERAPTAARTSKQAESSNAKDPGASQHADAADEFPSSIHWITGIDLMQPDAGEKLASAAKSHGPVDVVIVNAGFFAKESFKQPNWDDELRMYTTSSIAPVFLVRSLVKAGLIKSPGGKIIMTSSEAGSIALRLRAEGGGNYAHHASKTALNMVTKLLAFDLEEQRIAVGAVHPGFIRTEMTRNVGYDSQWDDAGAVVADEGAKYYKDYVDAFGMDKTGTYYAVMGAAGIGSAEEVIGKNLPVPLKLPY